MKEPFRLGDSIDNKTFVLDINIILNRHHIINLEMQVINLNNWQDRSLSYLARNFDHLKRAKITGLLSSKQRHGRNYKCLHKTIITLKKHLKRSMS